MARGALDQLTEAQRECLRLVYAHHNSKEIAEIVGVSPSAIDKRLERAIQLLGASSRFAAARMLAVEEGVSTYERTPSDTFDLSPAAAVGPMQERDGSWWLVHRLLGLAPRDGGRNQARNTLSKLERLGVIVGLMFLIAMTSVALLNLGETLSGIAATARSTPGR